MDSAPRRELSAAKALAALPTTPRPSRENADHNPNPEIAMSTPDPVRRLIRRLLILPFAALSLCAAEDRLTFNLNDPQSTADQKASGLLGGFDRGAPEDALIQPLKLQFVRLSQATQLPLDDPFALYDRAVTLGIPNVILIASDSVKCTDPTYSDPTNWRSHWGSQVTALATRALNEGKNFIWDIYNEPDKKIDVTAVEPSLCGPPATNPTMTMASYPDWFAVWDEAYNAIRTVSPNARITGPSYSTYDEAKLKAFIDHCAAEETMPDIINWHFGPIANYQANADTIRAYAASYGYTVDICIGEAISAGTDRNLDPGLAVTLFANAERADINTLHAAWTATAVAGIPQAFAPHLAGLLTPDTMLPRGAWWSYQSYGEMTGSIFAADRTAAPNLDGLASFDASAHRAIALVGTTDKPSYTGGTGKVKFLNVTSATGLLDASGYVHVKAERLPLTEAELTTLPLISEGDWKPSASGTLEIPFDVTSGREAVKITLSLPTVAAPARLSGRVEAESLTATVNAGQAITAINDAAASGGKFSKAALTAAGDWVQYTFTAPAAGTYWLNLGYKADPSRAIVQVSIDGVNLGGALDQSTNASGYPDANVGACTLTAGTHVLRLTVLGKSATATGYSAAIDYYRLSALTPIEGEDLTAMPSPGDSAGRLTDAGASNGALKLCNLNAVGDYVDFSVFVPAPGLYSLSSTIKKFSSRGMFQVKVDGVPKGPVVDGYSASPAFVASRHGSVTFPTAGLHVIRLEIVGKNTASTGYTIGLDSFALVPAALGIVAQADQLPVTASGGATFATPTYFNARGGSYSKVSLLGVMDTVTYTFNVPDAGLYFLAVRYVSGPDGGRFQLNLNGTDVYAPIDTYAYAVGCTEVGIGSYQLAAGAHTLTFRVTGAADCSTGYALGLDTLRSTRVQTVIRREAELLPTAVSGGTWSIVANPPPASGSYVDAAIDLGDYVSFQFDPLPAGAYRLETGFLAATNQGRFVALVDGYTVGRTRTAVYSSMPLIRDGNDANTDFGSFVLTSAGTYNVSYLTAFTSPGTRIGIDYLLLTQYERDR